MAVRRYRRVEDVPRPAPAPTVIDGLRAACALSELCAGIGRTSRAPRGVLRFRSVQEAHAHRRAREEESPSPTAGPSGPRDT